MANANRDQNSVPTLLAVSSVDGTTPVKVKADPTTGRILTDSAGLAGTKVYYVADSSGGAVTRKLTFVNGTLTSET